MNKKEKVIALVAHDNIKANIIEWVDLNRSLLSKCKLVCTGTTGKLVAETLKKGSDWEDFAADITLLKSGPLGGDQQLGAMIAESKIDVLIFLWDPMEAQPHDVDVKALLRLATLYNVPTAVNRATADFLISSPLFVSDNYMPVINDYQSYIERKLKE